MNRMLSRNILFIILLFWAIWNGHPMRYIFEKVVAVSFALPEMWAMFFSFFCPYKCFYHDVMHIGVVLLLQYRLGCEFFCDIAPFNLVSCLSLSFTLFNDCLMEDLNYKLKRNIVNNILLKFARHVSRRTPKHLTNFKV